MKLQPTKRPKIDADDANGWRKEAKHFRKYLVELSNANLSFIAQLDELMKQPSTIERGRAISKLTNALDMANDSARYFGLGVDYRTDKKLPTK